MAVATQGKVQLDRNGGVTANTVVDQRTGLVAKQETSGSTTVLLKERVKATRIPNWIHNSTREPHYHQIQPGGVYRGSQLDTGNTNQVTEPKGSTIDLICLPFFASCDFTRLCIYGTATLVLIGLTAGGPMQCDRDDAVYYFGIATLFLLSSFFVLMVLCCCYGCCNNNKKPGEAKQVLNGIIYCLCTLIAFVFMAFLIWSSVLVFGPQQAFDDDCNSLSIMPLITVMSVYVASLLFLCRCVCCYSFMCLETVGYDLIINMCMAC